MSIRLSITRIPSQLLIAICVSACVATSAKADAPDAKNSPSAKTAATKSTSQKQSRERVWFRLVSVVIPPDSALRNDSRLNNPPTLYVKIRKNGRLIDIKTTYDQGWGVNPAQYADGKKNVWPIWLGTNDRYTIEVWDSQGDWYADRLDYDVQIFSITDLKGEDFKNKVFMKGSRLTDKSSLPWLEFETTTMPKRYAAPTSKPTTTNSDAKKEQP